MTASPREALVGALRRLRLLQTGDRVGFLLAALRARRENNAFRRRNADFPTPPLSLCYDAYGHVRYEVYRETGRRHAEFIASLIRAHGPPGALDALEWGCGPARVLRHLQALLPAGTRLAGSDYNPKSIAWCRAHFPAIEFRLNALSPPLEFPDGRFDAAYALSVFTHLSAPLHDAWRDELLRVLKPGGVMILTLQGDVFRDRHLTPDERRAYDKGQPVIRGGVQEGMKWYSAFHPPSYVRNHLLRDFEILEHHPRPEAAGIEQDVWIARRPR
jgi:SAM-dependent methyltransferase